MIKVIKYLVIVPIYIFMLIEGFIGGGNHSNDIWDDLVKWAGK